MISKVDTQTWLDSIYKLKEKWAECYMRDVFTLGMRSTQLSESLNNDLKINLCTSTSTYPCTIPTNTSLPNDLLDNAHLKKKEVETKTSKRKRTWLDKKHKTRKKREKQNVLCSLQLQARLLLCGARVGRG